MKSILGGSFLVACVLLAGCGERSSGPDAGQASVPVDGAPQVLDWPLPAAVPGTLAPDLAIASDGRVLLSWIDAQPGRRHLFRYSTWSAPQQRWLHPAANIAVGHRMHVDAVDTPHLMAAADGALWAHWLQAAGEATDLVLARARDGVNWVNPQRPYADDRAARHGHAALWAHGTNLLGLAWLARPTGDAGAAATLEAVLTDPDRNRLHAAQVDTGACADGPVVAQATARGPLLAWRAAQGEVRMARLQEADWTAPQALDPAHVPGLACSAALALAARDEAVVMAWQAGDGALQLAHSTDAGVQFSAPVTVEGAGTLGPAVAVVRDADRVRLVWRQDDADGATLWYAQYAADLSREYGRVQLARLHDQTHGARSLRMVTQAGQAYVVFDDQTDGRAQLRGVRVHDPAGQ